MQSRWDIQWAACNCVKVSSMSVHNMWENDGLYYGYYFFVAFIFYNFSFLTRSRIWILYKLSSNIDTEGNATVMWVTGTAV